MKLRSKQQLIANIAQAVRSRIDCAYRTGADPAALWIGGRWAEHEMEAALVAHQVARRLGWDREASSAARYAKRYATSLRSSDSQDEKEGHDTVVSAYAPDGATQERIRATVEKIVSAFMQTHR
jgi:hypothetical protein